MIIGLAGYAQAGKDEVAKVFVSQGFTRFAFADKLKQLATELQYWNGTKDELGRLHLQYLGNKVRDILGDNIWIDAMMRDASHIDNVVISDVRYNNEIHAVHDAGGLVLRVNRPGTGPINNHVSEGLPEHSSLYDGYIHNDGSLDELRRKVLKWLMIETS